MNLRSFDPVHIVAAHLAVLVAVIHLALGVSNWLTYLRAGTVLPPDLRWPLFVVSGTHHHGSTLGYLAAHVVAGPVETLSLAAETGLAVLLGSLLYRGA